ncbi:MAG: cyclic nucleotide-binding domain-containing protein [Alphaproteobacteria bacterium]|nr:cyclic nucleotide-binding domain-containing protein [Alphaproteobacteria bacterium]MCB9694378.1 cyclic nucleotide-binding domain-containing protein [Alphaproteobacteria bacterium]
MPDLDLLTLTPGEVLYEPGDPSEALYTVEAGEMEAFLLAEGTPVGIRTFAAGGTFGAHGVRTGEPRTVGMRAVTAVTLRRGAGSDDVHPKDRTMDMVTKAAVDRVGRLARRYGVDPGGSRLVVYAAGHVVAEQDAPPDAVWFVLRGEAEASRKGKVLGTMTPGDLFGEVGVVDGAPRSARLLARTDLVCLEVDAETFSRWLVDDMGLRAIVALQRSVYRGPGGRSVTRIGSGTYEGEPCVTSVVTQDDGTRWSATKTAERTLWKRLEDHGVARTVVGPEGDRSISLTADDRLVAIETMGDSDGLEPLCRKLIQGRPIKPVLVERFAATGRIGGNDGPKLLCACVGLTEADAKTLDPLVIRGTTGAGTVCGGCDRRIRQLETTARGTPVRGPITEQVPLQPFHTYVEGVLTGRIVQPTTDAIDAALRDERPEVFAPENRGVGVVVGLLLRVVLVALASVWSLDHAVWLLPILIAVQGLNGYGLSSVAHDTAHGAMFQGARANRWVGTATTWLLFASWRGFRASHLQHHRLNQSGPDPKVRLPTDHPLPDIVRNGLDLYLRRIYEPAPRWLAAVFQACLLLVLAWPMMLKNNEFSPFRRPTGAAHVAELVGLVAFWAVMARVLGPWALLVVAVLPLFASFALIAIVFSTHGAETTLRPVEHDDRDADLMIFNITDLTLGPALDRLGLYFHRHHVAHHLQPSLPYWKLPEVDDFIRERYAAHLFPVQALTMDFVKRGYFDALVGWQPWTCAGRTFLVGPRFHEQEFGG